MDVKAGLTASLIPCCTCGAIIAPNPSNQCPSCVATVDVGSILRRGPGGGNLTIYQCRQCRRYDRGGDGRFFAHFDQESPEMMTMLLKQIPALSGKGQPLRRSHGLQALSLLDSIFVWTEPHSMRMRLMLTVKADVNESPRTVSIKQRVLLEFIVQWRQCTDCTNESRQRTWQSIVQLRQKRSHSDGGNKGLLILELAIARNAELRKHIVSVQTKKYGFDFYFPSLDKARHFSQYLAKAAPMRIKTSQKLVSEDLKNNTANVKHTVSCDMVPLCRDDLIVTVKNAKGVGRLAGRLCLVLKVSSVVHLVDASPIRGAEISSNFTNLHPENYWKGGEEKSFRLLLSPRRLIKFVVLDVELCCRSKSYLHCDSNHENDLQNNDKRLTSDVYKYAIADVEVARESDFGNNNETFHCVTHLGHLVSVGDIVMGYDLTSTVLSGATEWSVENTFLSNFDMPDVVIVRKIKGGGAASDKLSDGDGNIDGQIKTTKAKSSASKKRDRRLHKEERKQRHLEAVAERMGLNSDKDIHRDESTLIEDDDLDITEAVNREKTKLEYEIDMDEDLARDLELIENELRIVDSDEQHLLIENLEL